MVLGDGNAFHHRQHRNVGRLVIFKAEDSDRIRMRHLPQAKDSQQDQRAGVELVGYRAVADNRRRGARQAADQRAVDRVAFHVQAVNADINHEAHHRQPHGQRVGRDIQQREAHNTQNGRINQGDTRRDQAFYQHPILRSLHFLVDVAVDVVVKHTARRDHQRDTHQGGEKQGIVDAPFGSEQESPNDRN